MKTAPGFPDAYQQFVEGGWLSLSGSAEFGGQGLPFILGLAVQEMIDSANMSFGLCPILTSGAIDAIEVHAADDLKEKYLPKMISGEWTGTMNLTEPQAGSDVGALTNKAEPVGDGTYRIKGQKIFITFGDHDMAENTIHLVLARLPDAPIGTRGISLFLVPKYFVNDDGSLGERNDAKCVSLEHKLGIHASPTCVMAYGDDSDGAIGWLVGAENRGMAAMFTMMNSARLNVGLQGVAIAERAFQQALTFSQERRQGKPVGKQHDQKDMVPIIEHADVRRNLMTMKAYTEAARAICYLNAINIDRARALDGDAAADAQLMVDFLTPISKAWSTDIGVEMASIGVQIHGGMGFIEETGAAQHLRDSRIAPIYEGTNGIQAMDLVSRKLPLKDGELVKDVLDRINDLGADLQSSDDDALVAIGTGLATVLPAARQATEFLSERLRQNPQDALGGATPYCRLMGVLLGGYLLAVQAKAAQDRQAAGDDDPFLKAKIETAAFFAENLLPEILGLKGAVTAGADRLFALDADALGSAA